MIPIKKIDHIVITTKYPEACIEFYEALGFEARDAGGRYELFAGDFKINVHIGGAELSPHAGHVQPGSADMCFEVGGSVDDLKKELEQKKIPIELGVVGRSGVCGEMRSLYLRDPDGNLVEFCSYG